MAEAAHDSLSCNYVVLSLDGLRLLVPQDEVHTLEPEADAEVSTPIAGAVACYPDMSPVFVLPDGLDGFLMERSGRPICVLLEGGFGLLCSEVTLLSGAGLDFKPVPAAMQEQDSPLLGIAVDEEGLLCLSSAAGLRRHIELLGGFDLGEEAA